MSVKEIAKNKYKIDFKNSYNEILSAGQNDTGKIIEFIITEENESIIDISNMELEMLILSRWHKETINAIQSEDNTFKVIIPQSALKYADLNGKYQLFLSDSTGTISTRSGVFAIHRDERMRSEENIDIQLDFEEIKKAVNQINENVERGEEVLNNVIVEKDKVIKIKEEILEATDGIKEQADEIRENTDAVLEVKDKVTNIDETATYLKNNITTIENNVIDASKNAEQSRLNAQKSEDSKEEAIRIKSELAGTLDKEVERQQAESARKSNEDNRTVQENDRVDKEAKRILDENTRTESEETRVNNEISRIEEEYKRVSNEDARNLAEENRISNFKTWS